MIITDVELLEIMRVSTFNCEQSAYLQWRLSSNVKVLDTYRISAYTATRTVGVKLRRNIEDQNGSVSRKRTLEFCAGISESRKILKSGPTDLTGATPDLEMTSAFLTSSSAFQMLH